MSVMTIDDEFTDYALERNDTFADKAQDVATQMEHAAALLQSDNPTQRAHGAVILAQYAPEELAMYADMRVRNSQIAKYEQGFHDDFGDVVSDVSNVISAVVPGVGSAIGTAISAISGLFTTKAVDPDPNHPGRSLHDARTYLEELTNIYNNPYGFKTCPSTLPNNSFGANAYVRTTIIHVNQLPPLDQHIDSDEPSHIYGSLSGTGVFMEKNGNVSVSQVEAKPVTNGLYTLTYTMTDGTTIPIYGYFSLISYTDGSWRADYQGDTPNVNNPVPHNTGIAPVMKVNTQSSTAIVTAQSQSNYSLPNVSSATVNPVQSVPNQSGVVQASQVLQSTGASTPGSGAPDINKLIADIQSGKALTQDELNYISSVPALLALWKQYGSKSAGAGTASDQLQGSSFDISTLVPIAAGLLAVTQLQGQ